MSKTENVQRTLLDNVVRGITRNDSAVIDLTCLFIHRKFFLDITGIIFIFNQFPSIPNCFDVLLVARVCTGIIQTITFNIRKRMTVAYIILSIFYRVHQVLQIVTVFPASDFDYCNIIAIKSIKIDPTIVRLVFSSFFFLYTKIDYHSIIQYTY